MTRRNTAIRNIIRMIKTGMTDQQISRITYYPVATVSQIRHDLNTSKTLNESLLREQYDEKRF